jgi:hypothetical protein
MANQLNVQRTNSQILETLKRADASLSPHLWSENEEIDLGDGSFGFRMVGTVNVSATLSSSQRHIMHPLFNDGIRIHEQGGFAVRQSPSLIQILVGNSIQSPCVSAYIAHVGMGRGIGVTIQTSEEDLVGEYSYDVWIRYTRG